MTDPQTKALITRLTDSIRGLREQVESIRKDQQSYHKSAESQPSGLHIASLPDLDPTRTEYYQAENAERKRFWVKHKAKFEVTGIAIAAALAFLNWLVLVEIQKQTPQVKNSAEAARISAATAAKQLDMIERPWITIDNSLTSDLISD